MGGQPAVAKGLIHPTLSKVYPLDETGQAALDVHRNAHQGKVGVLALVARRRDWASSTTSGARSTSTEINRFRGV